MIMTQVASLPVVFLIIVNLVISGCVNVRIRMGQRPNIDALEKSLRIGESRSNDVISILGEPFGKGRIMLPIDPKPRTMWTYYYGEGDLQDGRAIYLFVHFNEDLYDGYMWFASLPTMGDKTN
jgi:hypothetical protein